MPKMGKIYGKITHFRHFWAILPILVGKKITDLNGFKKTRVKFIETYICANGSFWKKKLFFLVFELPGA
jgi:hypothetical protein